jgi:large subunit ribosomal protein L30
MAKRATIKVRQTGSALRRRFDQRQNLIGLGLNKIGRVADVPDTPATRGMIARVRHLVEVIEPQGDKS